MVTPPPGLALPPPPPHAVRLRAQMAKASGIARETREDIAMVADSSDAVPDGQIPYFRTFLQARWCRSLSMDQRSTTVARPPRVVTLRMIAISWPGPALGLATEMMNQLPSGRPEKTKRF